MITKKKHLANLDTNPTHQSDSLSQFARRRRHRELKISFLNPTQTRRYINTFRTSTISTCHLYTKTHPHQAPASRVSANFFLPRACSQCVHTIYSRYTMYTFETSFFQRVYPTPHVRASATKDQQVARIWLRGGVALERIFRLWGGKGDGGTRRKTSLHCKLAAQCGNCDAT